MFFTTLLITTITILTHLTLSAALPQRTTHPLSRRDPISQLLSIMPSATTCNSAPIPSECATASQALSPILSSFSTYSITTASEQAALLSWDAYESASLKYNANHFPIPGRPGQGTRVMLMPNYVEMYAASIPALAGKVVGLAPADVLALVQGDEYSFGSAAWFYSSQCSKSVKDGVRGGTMEGWEGFVTGCVGTSVDEGTGDDSRVAYWQRAMSALSAVAS